MSTLTSGSTPESRTVNLDRVRSIQNGILIPQSQINQSEWVEIINGQIQSVKFLFKHSPDFLKASDCVRVFQGVMVEIPVTQETMRDLKVKENLKLHILVPNRLPSIAEPPIPGFHQWIRSLFIDQGGNFFVHWAEQRSRVCKMTFDPVALADLPLTAVDKVLAASVLQHDRCVGYLILMAIQDLITKALERKKQHVLSLERSRDALSLVASRISVQ